MIMGRERKGRRRRKKLELQEKEKTTEVPTILTYSEAHVEHSELHLSIRGC